MYHSVSKQKIGKKSDFFDGNIHEFFKNQKPKHHAKRRYNEDEEDDDFNDTDDDTNNDTLENEVSEEQDKI